MSRTESSIQCTLQCWPLHNAFVDAKSQRAACILPANIEKALRWQAQALQHHLPGACSPCALCNTEQVKNNVPGPHTPGHPVKPAPHVDAPARVGCHGRRVWAPWQHVRLRQIPCCTTNSSAMMSSSTHEMISVSVKLSLALSARAARLRQTFASLDGAQSDVC